MVFSTQQAIDMSGVKDGVIIMKDGSYRIILQVAAINFALKSEQEQNSLVFQYQSFLNSLHFPVEFVIRSRRLDLAPYLKKLEDRAKEQTNELIRMQTEDYIGFVGQLINLANIMKKTFYAVVSYSPISVRQVSIIDKFFSKAQVFDHIKISDADFKAHTEKLKEQASVLASGLGGMGLHCFQLSTEQIIETFYQIYNPDEASKERLTDAENISSSIIISKDEMKGKEGEGETQTAPVEDQMIDNSQIVIAQHKQEAMERKQVEEKEAEKELRSPAETSPTAEAKPDTEPDQAPAVQPDKQSTPPASANQPAQPEATAAEAAPVQPAVPTSTQAVSPQQNNAPAPQKPPDSQTG